MSPPPETCAYAIVKEKWNDQPDIKDLATLDTSEANTWILCRLDKWEEENFGDEELWEVYKEDFEGWTKDTFLKAHRDVVRSLRNHLRD